MKTIPGRPAAPAPPDSGQAGSGEEYPSHHAGYLCLRCKVMHSPHEIHQCKWNGTECEWVNTDDGEFTTECGTSFFYEDEPSFKNHPYCSGCGRRVRIKPKPEADDTTEPEPAPAQTAREWVDARASEEGGIWIGHAYELADMHDAQKARADRAEAHKRALRREVERLYAERDRLREALEKIIIAFKGEPCVAPNHPEDGYKCKFSAHPIGRKWGGYCDKHNIDMIARAALNQTTNDQ